MKILFQYRMLKIYVRHGIKAEKDPASLSCEESKWLEKYISFNTQKRNKAKNGFKNIVFKLFNNQFFGQMFEKIRDRLKIEFI